MKSLLGFAFAVSAVFALAAPVFAETITAGTFNTSDCYPYLCNNSGSNSGQALDSETVYSALLFSGPTRINSITGFFDQAASGNSFVLAGSYTLYFGYAAFGSVGHLSTNLASNYIGPRSEVMSFDANEGQFNLNPSATLPIIGSLVIDPSGMLLWAVGAGMIARAVPESWYWPERTAARILRMNREAAGARLIETAAPDRWRDIVRGYRIVEDNRETIAKCKETASAETMPVRCVVEIGK